MWISYPDRPSLRLAIVCLLVLIAVALGTRPAGAEPRLVDSRPAEDATVIAAPATLDLVFLEPVPAVVLSLIDEDGTTTPLAATIDPGDPRHVTAALPDLGRGVWTIGWSVPDASGRPAAGTLAFHVGTGSAPGAATIAGEWPRPWALVTRWLTALGAGLAAGIALLALVRRRDDVATPITAPIGVTIGATVALLATLVEPLAAARFSTNLVSLPVATVIGSMSAGWWLRLAALGVLTLVILGLLASGRTSEPPGWTNAGGLALAVAGLLGLGLTERDPAAAGPATVLDAIVTVAYVVAVPLFAGTLGVVFVGKPSRPVSADAAALPGQPATIRLARLALAIGMIALVCGLILAALLLVGPAGWSGGSYGWLLLGTIGLIAVALALTGWANRARGEDAERRRPLVPIGLKLAAPITVVALGAAVTLPLLAAPGTETTPTLARLDIAAAVPLGADQLGQVDLSLAPAMPGENAIIFELETADGSVVAPTDAPLIDLRLVPLDHPGEPRSVSLVPDRFGGWATGAVDLPGAGWWRAEVTLVPPAGEGFRIPFWFVLPDPNATGRGPTPTSDPAAAAVFERAMATLADLQAVRYTQRLSDGSGSLYQSLLEVTDAVGDRPAAFAERSVQFQAIVVGDTQWLREAGEPGWRERTAPSLSLPSSWVETYRDAKGFRLGPVEEIDGEPCQMISFYLPRTSRTAAAWFAWWVGQESGWIHRETMVSTRHYMVYTFSDFNSDIAIEPPAPRQGPPATPGP